MDKIIIEDEDLNEKIFYKQSEITDIFIERYLADSEDPDSLIINFYEMSKPEIEALRYLHETDWWVIREVDRNDLTPATEQVLEAREAARAIL